MEQTPMEEFIKSLDDSVVQLPRVISALRSFFGSITKNEILEKLIFSYPDYQRRV